MTAGGMSLLASTDPLAGCWPPRGSARTGPTRERWQSACIFVGVDWAEATDDVHVADEDGQAAVQGPPARKGGGHRPLPRARRLLTSRTHEVLIGIETDRGLFVSARSPSVTRASTRSTRMSTSRVSGPHSTSGAKSDAGDADARPTWSARDRHHHRLVAADTDEVEAIKVLARAHQSMVWVQGPPGRHVALDAARALPGGPAAFDDLASGDALEVLRIAPTPSPRRLSVALRRSRPPARGGRQRRVDERAVEIQAALRSEQLAAPAAVEAAIGARSASVAVIAEMVTQIGHLTEELSSNFRGTPRRRSGPFPCQDWGPSSAPGCSASSATSRTATPTPSLAKPDAGMRRSPGPRHQEDGARPPRPQPPLGDAVDLWAFALSATLRAPGY